MHGGKTEEWNDYLLRVTEALYRVTELLSVREPLRMALREYANRVLAGCVAEMHGAMRGSARTESAIGTMLGFLAVARTLSEVKAENFMVLEREYRAFLAAYAREARARAAMTRREADDPRVARADQNLALREESAPSALGRAGPTPKSQKNNATNERQQAILERLTKTPQAKVSDFYEIFHSVSPKTIQRDLQDLVARNAIKKDGERRWTTYTLAGSASS